MIQPRETKDISGSAPALYDWQTGTFRHEIHMTHVNTFLRCPKQFAAKYIDNLREPEDSIELSIGRIHHNFLEEAVLRKLGSPFPPFSEREEIADFISWNVDEQAERMMDTEKADELTGQKDTIIAQALVLDAEYIQGLAPKRIEQKFRISIPDTPYSLVGTVDIERHLDEDEKVLQNKRFGIDDLKTAGKSPSKHPKGGYKPKPDHHLQQTAYSFGAWIANGGSAANYQQTMNRTVYLVKNKKPVVRPAVYVVTRSDVMFLYETVVQMTRALMHGVLPPNPNGWWCTPDRCPIYQSCKKHSVLTFEQVKQAKT